MRKHVNNRSVFSGVVWTYAERMAAQVVSLVVSIVLARLLFPEDYGILSLVNVFVAIADTLVTGGYGIALVQKKDSDKVDFNSICWLSVGISTLLYIALFVGAPFISDFYQDAQLTLITRVLGIRIIFSAFNSIQQAYIQKHMLFRMNFIVSTIAAIASGVVGILLAYHGFGVWALVVQNIVLVVFSTLILLFLIEWKPSFQCSMRSIKEMWSYGSKVFLVTVVDTLNDNGRSLVVGKVFSSSDLAFYNQGKKFPQLIANDIVNSVGKVLLPVFSSQQEDKSQNKELIRVSVRTCSFIFLPAIFGLFGIADTFVELFLTEKWLPCVPYFRILCLVYATRSISTILKNSLLAVGRSGYVLFHEVITTAVTVVLIALAAFTYRSVQLIAWSYVIVSVLGTVIYYCFVHKEYRYAAKELLRDYLPSFLLSAIMAAVVYLCGRIPMLLIGRIAVQILLGAGIYAGVAYFAKMQELQYLLQFFKNKLLHQKATENNH